jgi:hypothetical protein
MAIVFPFLPGLVDELDGVIEAAESEWYKWAIRVHFSSERSCG